LCKQSSAIVPASFECSHCCFVVGYFFHMILQASLKTVKKDETKQDLFHVTMILHSCQRVHHLHQFFNFFVQQLM